MKTINERLLIVLIGILIINTPGFAQPILEWSKNYGGSNTDIVRDFEKTADGGYILAGLSRSNDGDVGGNNGDLDSWIIKLDNEGNLEWSKYYGGSDRDVAVDIIQTTDTGYAILCYSQSNDGDVGGNNGGRDYWIVKLDNEGNLEWEKNYGGSVYDTPSIIKADINGGYIISGWSGSIDGDVVGNNGSNDSWLVKLDNEGDLEWEKNYGGSDNDVTYDMDQTIDGGYILAGRSKSNDGIVGGNNGEHDCWIIKLDAEGNFEWGKNYGGSENDAALSIKQTTSGEYIVAGDTESNDGNVGGNNGDKDTWIIKLDAEGNLEWEKNYGGSNADWTRDIVQIADDEYIVAGWSESNDGDIIENNGNADFWLIKIDQITTSVQIPNIDSKVAILPNPSNGHCMINTSDIDIPMNVRIFNTMGHSIYRKNEVYGPFNIVNLPKGNHYIQIVSDEFSITRKLIVL